MLGVVPYYDADFGSVETGLGPVVHTLRLTLSQWRMILVWDHWSCTHYDADFGLVETGLGPMVHTLRLTFELVRYILDHFFFFIIRTKAEQNRTMQEQSITKQISTDQCRAEQVKEG